ncbi:MAG: hypothetical protein ACRDD8_01025 [Bacteroidales bacterium]
MVSTHSDFVSFILQEFSTDELYHFTQTVGGFSEDYILSNPTEFTIERINTLLSIQLFSIDFMESVISVYGEDSVNWEHISKCQDLNESFLLKYKHKLQWNFILERGHDFSDNIIQYIKANNLDVNTVSVSKIDREKASAIHLSEEYIEKHKDTVDWVSLSKDQKLSEAFIRKYMNKVVWKLISRYQVLSESFMEEFQVRIDWDMISMYQKLSEEFILKHRHKVNWVFIVNHQNVSEHTQHRFKHKIPSIDDEFLYESNYWFLP